MRAIRASVFHRSSGGPTRIGAALVSARGRITATTSAGDDIAADYGTAPALGLTLSYRL